MAVQALSTAGMVLKYAVEATAGTRPTTGYVAIPGVKTLPPIGDSVNTIDATTLAETVCHRYVIGLADPGGALQITVNDAPAFRTAYATMYTAYTTAKASGKGFWFEIVNPDANMDSLFIPCEPAKLGFAGAEVDSVLENTLNYVPAGDFVYAAAST